MSPEISSRNTRQRQVILDELCKLTCHPTAVGLYEIVRKRLPRISLGTVYRNLERLAASGAVRKLELGGKQARFDGDVAPHDHFRCLCCGRVDDVRNVRLDLSQLDTHDLAGYEVRGRRLEIVGVCPQCRAAPASATTTQPRE